MGQISPGKKSPSSRKGTRCVERLPFFLTTKKNPFVQRREAHRRVWRRQFEIAVEFRRARQLFNQSAPALWGTGGKKKKKTSSERKQLSEDGSLSTGWYSYSIRVRETHGQEFLYLILKKQKVVQLLESERTNSPVKRLNSHSRTRCSRDVLHRLFSVNERRRHTFSSQGFVTAEATPAAAVKFPSCRHTAAVSQSVSHPSTVR